MRDSLDPAARSGDPADRSMARSSASQPLGDAIQRGAIHRGASARFAPRPLWHERFAAICQAHADRSALVHTPSGQRLTYGELQQRVQERSRALGRLGVGPDVAVAVLLPAGIQRIVTLLAVVTCGGAYVPLDPSYPARRWQLMVEDTEASLLIHDAPLPADCRLPEACRALSLQQMDDLGARPSKRTSQDGSAEAQRVLPQAAAYIVYTSGSTGRPRGVPVSHRALAWYVDACIGHYALTPQDRLPQLASIGFDISVGEIFPSLAAGATLQLPAAGPMAADELLAFCRQWETTVLFPATALWHELARHVSRDPQSLPPSLRLISFGGEKVSDKLLASWLAKVGDAVQLFNGYGPTEATVEATRHDLTQAMSTSDPHATTAAVIGHPVAGVHCHVLDVDGNTAADGDVGELCIDSPGLARGYLGHASMTALKFVPNPFSDRPGGRLYRSGDLVRQGHGGRLEILGRLDQQVKIRGYRIEPGEIEGHLMQHPRVAEARVVAVGQASDDLHLVACVVPHRTATSTQRVLPEVIDGLIADTPAAPTAATGILGVGAVPSMPRQDPELAQLLRGHLQRLLPPHHIPGQILVLDEMPLNERRKVDRFRLVHLAESSLRVPREGEAAPQSLEQQLAQIWRHVLRLDQIGLDDDFFNLGGDSILAIRVVAAIQAQGLRLSPREIFELRTVRRLSSLARRRQHEDSNRPSNQEVYRQLLDPPLAEPVPLTPVQRWFFDEAVLANPNHFNQSMLVHLLDPEIPRLRRALALLVEQHEALRLRFHQTEDGTWRQRLAPGEEADLLRLFPEESEDPSRWLEAADALQASLDIEHGPLLRCGLQDGGDREPSRLLICIHHLVVDGVSWGILLQDLEQLYLQLKESAQIKESAPPPQVPAVSTSYRGWSVLQDHIAQQEASLEELPFWLAQYQAAPRLPIDAIQGRRESSLRQHNNTLQSTSTVTVHLSRLQTQQLLRELPAAYRTRINDVLLCAVTLALTEGQNDRRCHIDVEGHGREELFPGLDLSRTVGWFTSTFPLLLALPSSGDLRQSLLAIKEQLRRVPRHGIGFGWLYALCRDPEVRRHFDDVGHPDVSFNYLGQLDALLRHSRIFAPADAPRGAEKCVDGRRPYALEIDGGVVDGRLWLNWHYSRNLHQRSTIEGWAQHCRHTLIQLIEHCLEPSVGTLTPTDVPLSGLRQDQLDHLPLPHRDIADLYPLTPTQEGMLFHHRLHPTSPIYFEQSAWTLEGPLDVARWRAAWQHLVDAHPALRTAFVWQDLPRPLQAVWQQIRLPMEQRDLRHLGTDARRRQMETWLEEDRAAGFDLRRPPLSRLLLVRWTPTQYRFVWSYHHALLDGWSIARLFDDAFAIYEQLAAPLGSSTFTPSSPPLLTPFLAPSIQVTPLRDYIAWLEHRDSDSRGRAEAFWRARLQGLKGSSSLSQTPSAAPRPRQTLHRTLAPTLATRLETRAKQLGTTVAVLVQGAWAVLLSRILGSDDVVFGSTVSTRPTELPGVEHIVGLMIHTLPIRLQVDGRRALSQWLLDVHQELLDVRQYPYGLADIQRWSPLPPGDALFDHLLVFENYPTEKAMEADQRRGDLRVFDYQGFDETDYPWTLGILPGNPMRLDVGIDPIAIDPRKAARWLARLAHLLEALSTGPDVDHRGEDTQVGDLPSLTPTERHQVLHEWGEGIPDIAPPETFLDRFLLQAQRCPEAWAVISPQESVQWTYGELVQRASSLAANLGAGSQPLASEEPIGVLLERRAERLVATLAILMAGGVYVPLDVTYPASHLEMARRVAGVRRWVTRPQLARRILGDESSDLEVIPPDAAHPISTSDNVGGTPGSASGLHGDRLAYVLMTSGSTGRPKAVGISHRSLQWYCRSALQTYQIHSRDRVAHLSPVAFDFSVCEIFPALSCGAAVVLAPPDMDGSAGQLFDFCRRHEISVLFPPTTRWHQLVDDVAEDPSMLPASLRLLASGGEAILPHKLRRWQKSVGRSPRLMSGYGPTEATVEASLVCLSDLELADFDLAPRSNPEREGTTTTEATASSLGRPFPGAQVRVLDDSGRPQGIGQVGEICLGGPGLARGYLGRPAATASRFLPDPFAAEPGRRLYRTGDLGFFDAQGQLHFAGRRDWQLKIRGHRIEPGMVENAVSSLGGVHSVAVIGRHDVHGGGWLEVFVVLEPDATWDPRPWRRALVNRLPSHLLPARWHSIDGLPLTPAGKVDRQRLIELAERNGSDPNGSDQNGSDRNGEPGAAEKRPLSASQKRLAGAWTEVLGEDLPWKPLTPCSHFFALGGHSLLAARLVQVLRQRLGFDLALRDVFVYPTLEEMAERLRPVSQEGTRAPTLDPVR